MATRSHIRFIQGSNKIQLFKFHDGMIDSMKEHFEQFFKLCRNLDFNEIVPSWITYAKLEAYEKNTVQDFLENEWNKLCLEVYMTEISDEVPSDIEFFYVIDLDKKTITEKWTKESWEIKEVIN